MFGMRALGPLTDPGFLGGRRIFVSCVFSRNLVFSLGFAYVLGRLVSYFSRETGVVPESLLISWVGWLAIFLEKSPLRFALGKTC